MYTMIIFHINNLDHFTNFTTFTFKNLSQSLQGTSTHAIFRFCLFFQVNQGYSNLAVFNLYLPHINLICIMVQFHVICYLCDQNSTSNLTQKNRAGTMCPSVSSFVYCLTPHSLRNAALMGRLKDKERFVQTHWQPFISSSLSTNWWGECTPLWQLK